MYKTKIKKACLLLASLVLLLGVSVQATLAYITAGTDTVTNTFVPVKVIEHDMDIKVTGEKELQGRDWQEGDSFMFILQQRDGSEWTTKGTASATYEGGSSFDFSDEVKEQLTAPGTYNFRITEAPGSLEHITYDPKACTFEVTVTADSAGAMDIASVKNGSDTTVVKDDNGDYAVGVRFTNKYVKPVDPPVVPDPDDIEVKFNIRKSVENVGAGEIGPEGFEFLMIKDSTKEEFTSVSDKNGDAVFKMEYSKDDIGKTYIYDVTEVDTGKEYVTYSDAAYQITVSITKNEANELVPTITLDGKTVAKVNMEFENVYDKPLAPDNPDDPTKPTDPDQPDDKDDSSQTGDDFNMTLWLVLMLAAGVAVVITLAVRRRR